MEAAGGGVETGIDGDGLVGEFVAEIGVGDLAEQAALGEGVNDIGHGITFLLRLAVAVNRP